MSERLRELLLQAVRQLDPDEQDEVLGELLTGGYAPWLAAAQQPLTRLATWPRIPHDRADLAERLSAMVNEGGDLKMLPVRLPTADYERLRAWSRGHGFSMAVIIRSLVERFLNDQDQAAPPSPTPTAVES